MLVSPNPFEFAAQPPAHDPSACLALRAARLERNLLLRDISRLNIPVIDWCVRQPLYPLVRDTLNQAFIRRERLESAL
jgi:hypothetical protein